MTRSYLCIGSGKNMMSNNLNFKPAVGHKIFHHIHVIDCNSYYSIALYVTKPQGRVYQKIKIHLSETLLQ